MKTIAIIDLDTKRDHGEATNKMIANNSARAQAAQEYASAFSGKEQTSAFFEKMFDPSLVASDVIEDQARTWLEMIEKRGAEIIFLTSRPHTMSAATRTWLAENNISHPTIYKNYGTGEPDQGDRWTKTTEWKKREVQRILDEMQPDSIIFADDEEANRAAIAQIGDPRILIRCSLEDAATHDFAHHQADENAPAFLRRLQELANILEEREQFDSAEKYECQISHPLILGQQEPGTIVMLEAWRAGAFAPGAEAGGRFYRYSELYPQYDEHGELVCSLEVNCDQAGRIASVKMARPGPFLTMLKQLEEKFDMATEQEQAQEWADGYMADAIKEHGYVEAARAVRGMQTIGKTAQDAYVAHVEQKNEEIKAALRGKRGQDE